MTQPGVQAGQEVIDLLSDSEDEFEFFDAARIMQQNVEDWPALDNATNKADAHFSLDDGETIDLTAIPDVDVPPSDFIAVDDTDPEPIVRIGDWVKEGQLVTEEEGVQLVLDVLPDISVDHVLRLMKEKTSNASRTTTQCELLLTEIIDGGEYPKEADESKKKKRKREDEDGFSDYEKGERDPEVSGYERDAIELLKDEFLNVPVRHITHMLQKQKTLFKTYGVIEEQVRNYLPIATPFSKIHKSRPKRGTEFILIESGSQLPKELHAAKRKKETDIIKRRKAQAFEEAEQANLEQAQMNNEMGECACCFNEVPLNRMISCNGDTLHFYCVDCPRQQIETQMGQSRCRPKCFAVDNCDGTFSRTHLQQVLSQKTFERLEHMQQLEDVKAAELEDLSECPFCDFKMECPPVEVDREFRCLSKKCGKTSCRICHKETHIPLNCEESKKDGQLTLRHIVEEAMSSALIRHCNRCKHPFIKDYGCNKMTCTHCRNVQCYVCSENVRDYQHFGEAARGKCPLHENIEDRHEQEVKRAADEAMAKVRADNPGLSDADLMIKVSDRVKQAEDARRGRATADANAFPFQMVDDMLRRRQEHAPIPMVAGQPAQLAQPHVPAFQPPPPPNMNIGPVPQYVPLQPFHFAIAPAQVPFLVPRFPPTPAVNNLAPVFQRQLYQHGNQLPAPVQFEAFGGVFPGHFINAPDFAALQVRNAPALPPPPAFEFEPIQNYNQFHRRGIPNVAAPQQHPVQANQLQALQGQPGAAGNDHGQRQVRQLQHARQRVLQVLEQRQQQQAREQIFNGWRNNGPPRPGHDAQGPPRRHHNAR